MEIPRQLTTLGCVIGLAWTSAPSAAEPPGTRPTPKPGSLAAIAASRSLNRTPELEDTGVIVITDDNLDQLGSGAALTVMTSTIADPSALATDHRADPKTREKWRKKVLAQSGVIARLEARRGEADAELDRLERGKLDSRTLDRIAKAEIKLRAIDAEIRTAAAELSTIIRHARKDGAQPGWFR
jgi:hypothetical protein